MAQVIKPVNLDALSKWVGHIPDDVVEDMASIAPMLAHFGKYNKEHSWFMNLWQFAQVASCRIILNLDLIQLISTFSAGYDPEANPPNYGKADKVVVDNTNDIKAHDQDWEEIAEKVKSLSKKDTMPRGSKHDEIKDFDQWGDIYTTY